jgi:glycosyltransferase involved in cell wall biosynthesis
MTAIDTEHARISVVIPCRDEAKVIGATLGLLRPFFGEAFARVSEVVVVDNASSDGTADVARAAGVRGVRVVEQFELPGKGATVRAGVAATTGDVVVVTDADGDYLHNDAGPYLRALARGFDIVLASRAHPDSKWTFPDEIAAYALGRRRLGRIYNVLVRGVLPLHLSDTQTGLKLFRGDAARELFGDLRTDHFAYDVEVMVRARRRGMRVVEMPMVYHCSSADTKVRFRDKPRMVWDLLRIPAMVRGETPRRGGR